MPNEIGACRVVEIALDGIYHVFRHLFNSKCLRGHSFVRDRFLFVPSEEYTINTLIMHPQRVGPLRVVVVGDEIRVLALDLDVVDLHPVGHRLVVVERTVCQVPSGSWSRSPGAN